MAEAIRRPITRSKHREWPAWAVRVRDFAAFVIVMALLFGASIAFILVTEPEGGEAVPLQQTLPTVTGTEVQLPAPAAKESRKP